MSAPLSTMTGQELIDYTARQIHLAAITDKLIYHNNVDQVWEFCIQHNLVHLYEEAYRDFYAIAA